MEESTIEVETERVLFIYFLMIDSVILKCIAAILRKNKTKKATAITTLRESFTFLRDHLNILTWSHHIIWWFFSCFTSYFHILMGYYSNYFYDNAYNWGESKALWLVSTVSFNCALSLVLHILRSRPYGAPSRTLILVEIMRIFEMHGAVP